MVFSALKIGYRSEDLLKTEFKPLEKAYLLWLWSQSCVQTSSLGVKVTGYVGDPGYMRNERKYVVRIVVWHDYP